MRHLGELRKLSFWFWIGGAILLGNGPAEANAPRLGPDSADPATRPRYAADRIVVQLRADAAHTARTQIDIDSRSTSVASVDALLAQVGATGLSVTHIPARDAGLAASLGLDRWFTVTVPATTNIESWIRRFEADPNVEQASPDYLAYPTAIPNDTRYSLQWGHNNTAQMLNYCWGCGGHDSGSPVGTVGFDSDAQLAWDGAQGYGSASVIIAIIDSGVDIDHPDLRLVTGYDYGDNDSNPDDNSAAPGHGTACAGVAAARANNGLGVAGVAGGCSVMPLKVANSAGSMYFSSIQNALIHAADNGADVASMSLGAAISSDPSTDSALSYAYNAGVTILAATGNENASTISYPAINGNVIAVGAASPCGERKRSSSLSNEVNPGVNTDPNGYTCDGERWWGSNYGSNTQNAASAVDLIAPTILPTTDIGGAGGYNSGDYDNWFNGTSCATPYAAGVAGLVISANPSFTPAQVRAALVNSCTDITSVESGAGWDRYTGYGMVNAAGAVGSGGGGGGGGQEYAALPYTTGFEGGFDVYWDTQSSNSFGRIQTTSANTPHSGTSHLTMDVSTNGNYAQNEAWLHLDLTGESNVDLGFWWKEFGDETHTQDGVYFSNNGGASFVKVQNLNGASYTNNTWQQFALDLDALASANGLSLSDQFVVKFQQYDNYAIATDGFAFDDISVIGSGANTVTLTAPNGGETFTSGNSTNVTWTSTGSIANVALHYSTNAGAAWTSIVASTPNDGSYSWTVPATATTQGRVRVSDASNSSVNDASNGNFTIEVPSGGDYASLPYSTGFEGGLDSYWDTQSSNSYGRIQTTSANGPHGGTTHLTMDVTTSNNYAQNEAWLHLDLSGQTNVDLTFWWKEFGDETHTQDGVYFSNNGGASFVKVQNLNGASYTNNTWQQFALDVDALASANGLGLTGTFVVKFQQYDNYAISTDGFAFDDISVAAGGGGGGGGGITAESEPNNDSTTADGPISTGVDVAGALSSSSDDDWFYFDVTTAGNVNISLAIGGSADLDWYLYNSSLVEVARGYTVSNPETGSYNASPGRYYLWVDGYLGATSSYTVSVTGGLQRFSPADGPVMPKEVRLHTSAPNPFFRSTTLRFDLPRTSQVNLAIFDAQGRRVRTLVDREIDPGYHSIDWDGRDDRGNEVPTGVYFSVLQTPERTSQSKTIRMR